ncbi:MAG: MFS transporter, partial [Gammaproteobacteria bacterium]|nr:MFS transporter [Gammaproteobacteria bacterium]
MQNDKKLISCLGLILLMESFDSSALNLIFPTIAAALATTPLLVKVVLTCYLVAESIFIPLSGFLSHKFNLKTLLKIATISFALATLGCGLSNSIQ